MYTEKYVSEYSYDVYNLYLSTPSRLKALADAYINQYTNPTFDCTIAFKESLDHYIVKRFKNDPSFINSDELKNYFKYLYYIFYNRISTGNRRLEYNTNIVFRNPEISEAFFSLHNTENQNKVKKVIDNNEALVNKLCKKLDSNTTLTQDEINFLGDYFYTKRDLNHPYYSKFVEYILNHNQNLVVTPQLIAGYMSYLPKFYGENCEKSRVILSNGWAKMIGNSELLPQELMKDAKNKVSYHGLYSRNNDYISIDWKMIKDLNLHSDKSLNISRTLKKEYKDLYWITMVCFHELTHQKQNSLTNEKDINSSGLTTLIKYLKSNSSDYRENHDTIESEIEADESAWDKMYKFINQYRSNNYDKSIDHKIVLEQLSKCRTNRETVFARRAIQQKKNSTDRFFAADIKEIQSKLKDPVSGNKYLAFFRKTQERYPMLKKLFDENGRVNTSIVFEQNLTSDNPFGNDEKIMACEISNFVLIEGYDTLKRHLLTDKLYKGQIINLMMNVYNTYHLEKKYINSLSKIDFSQLDNTNTNINHNDKEVIRNKYLEKFKNVAELVYKEREMISIVNRRYPEYEIEKKVKPKYCCWNYFDMLKHLANINNGTIPYSKIEYIIEKYEKTKDPVLVHLAQETKNMAFTQTSDINSGLGKK